MKRRKSAPAKASPKKSVKTSAKSAGGKASLILNGEIWPVERDVLVRPDRFKYVRKLVKPKGCVFCASAEGEPSFENLCVHRTKHAMVVMNKFPYNSGHLLVLPRRHCGDLMELSEEEYGEMMALVRECMRALTELYEPGGMNLGLNHGAAGGAGIPEHSHYHIVPRWNGDLNFFPLIAETKVVVESLDQGWDRLRTWFANHGKVK